MRIHNLTAIFVLAEYLKKNNYDEAISLSPDFGRLDLVKKVSKFMGGGFAFFEKIRDRHTGKTTLIVKDLDLKGKIFDTALAAFLEESPLPGVCGRVCYHPCQPSCNRSDLDGAISVRAIERAAADRGQARPQMLSAAGADKPVAVVGSGPAGLACAYHLARLGHPVTLLEAAARAGGLLSSGIPGFRLPAEALKKDLERILSLSVTLKTGYRVDEKRLAELTASHAAVFLASGADVSRPLGVPGEDFSGVLKGLDFLRSEALQRRARDADVVVIGGGNTALDIARPAVRQGASWVRCVEMLAECQVGLECLANFQ